MPAQRVGQGIAAQVALARRESPARATRYAGWATVLVGELPHTFAALQRRDTSRPPDLPGAPPARAGPSQRAGPSPPPESNDRAA